MDISKLLAAYLIAQGAHTGGHFNEANSQSVPIRLDPKNLIEDWEIKSKPLNPSEVRKSPYANLILSNEQIENEANRRRSNIHGAGFSMQDRVRDSIEDPETKKDVSLMSALIKGAYLLGAPQALSKKISDGYNEDIGSLERTSGNKYIKHLVGMSALADIYGLPMQFTVVDGAPGLMYTKRF